MARILLAGDEPRLHLELLAFWLTRQGHEVMTAPDGPEVLSDTSLACFDLAVLGCRRATGRCASMVQLIRAHPDRGDTAIILLTRSATKQEIDQGARDGVTVLRDNPFTLPELSAVIDRVLCDGAA